MNTIVGMRLPLRIDSQRLVDCMQCRSARSPVRDSVKASVKAPLSRACRPVVCVNIGANCAEVTYSCTVCTRNSYFVSPPIAYRPHIPVPVQIEVKVKEEGEREEETPQKT